MVRVGRELAWWRGVRGEAKRATEEVDVEGVRDEGGRAGGEGGEMEVGGGGVVEELWGGGVVGQGAGRRE